MEGPKSPGELPVSEETHPSHSFTMSPAKGREQEAAQKCWLFPPGPPPSGESSLLSPRPARAAFLASPSPSASRRPSSSHTFTISEFRTVVLSVGSTGHHGASLCAWQKCKLPAPASEISVLSKLDAWDPGVVRAGSF